MKIKIPDEVLHILKVLSDNDFESYVVGGCVRDSLLGMEPEDWDIATDATPSEVVGVFDKTIETGMKHGTVTVLLNNESYEVTTFRLDGKYSDSRHPDNVVFTGSIKEDLGRRDFTINAIAYNPVIGIVDPYDGIKDIADSLIKTVGNPDRRFAEDGLRMIRAVRISAKHNFEIDKSTLESIKGNSILIKKISMERIRDELTGILVSPEPLKFILLRDTGLLQHLIPEFEICFHAIQNNPYHIYNVAVHSLYAVSFIESDKHLRWAMLLHDIGKPASKSRGEKGVEHFYGHPEKSVRISKGILKRLKFDNNFTDRVLRLIKQHDREIKASPEYVRRAVSKVGDDIFPDLLKVKEADCRAQNPDIIENKLEHINKIREIYENEKNQNKCMSLKELAINGNDLKNIGFSQGREIGITLNKLLQRVIKDPSLNEYGKLVKIAQKHKNS
jgi:tRNA nucleotidyltransferase (CCA-adding enzyme)